MANDKTEMNLSAYKNELVSTVLKELFVIVSSHEKMHGKQFALELQMTMLASLISTMVHNTLAQTAAKCGATDDAARDAAVMAEYFMTKRCIEAAIAQGFETAFHAFDRKNFPDFQCDIAVIDAGVDVAKINT